MSHPVGSSWNYQSHQLKTKMQKILIKRLYNYNVLNDSITQASLKKIRFLSMKCFFMYLNPKIQLIPVRPGLLPASQVSPGKTGFATGKPGFLPANPGLLPDLLPASLGFCRQARVRCGQSRVRCGQSRVSAGSQISTPHDHSPNLI